MFEEREGMKKSEKARYVSIHIFEAVDQVIEFCNKLRNATKLILLLVGMNRSSIRHSHKEPSPKNNICDVYKDGKL